MYGTFSDSEDDTSQDSDSYEWKYESSFTQGLAKPQAEQTACQVTAPRPEKSRDASGEGKGKARQDDRVEGSSLAAIDAATTSASESGTHLAPPSPSCAER